MAKFPDAVLDILVRKGNEGLLEDHPKLNKVLIWDKSKNKYSHLFQLLNEIRTNKYDAVLCVQRFFNAGLLTAFSDAKEKIGFDKNPFSFLFTRKVPHDLSKGKHEVDRNLELISHWIADAQRQPALYPQRKHKDKVEDLQTLPYICIAPASVWFTKQLPEEKWVELINRLSNYQVYLLGGQSDTSLCDRIIQASHHKHIKALCGKLNLLESAALIAKAEMNFVNDSAPLHLASSTNAPVVAFFCSTIKEFGFYPLSDHAAIAEINEVLDCRPCGLHGKSACPKGHFKCGKNIDINQVLQKLHL